MAETGEGGHHFQTGLTGRGRRCCGWRRGCLCLRCWTFREEGVVTGIAFQGKEFQVRIQPCKMGWDVLYTIELQRKSVQVLECRDLGIYVRLFVSRDEIPMEIRSQPSATSHSRVESSAKHPGRRPTSKFRHPLISNFLKAEQPRISLGISVSHSLYEMSR